MKNMEISALSGTDLCNIIRTCAKSGVSELNLGELRISFTKLGTTSAEPVETVAPLESGETSETSEPINYELSIAQQRAKEDLEVAQTIIDSPAEFEQQVIDSWLKAEDETEELGRA